MTMGIKYEATTVPMHYKVTLTVNGVDFTTLVHGKANAIRIVTETAAALGFK